ncbi:nucleotidyltransferase family protein [Thalassotalea sp. LPB0316]|uniref:N-acetylmuramate alpha-1-phosphate uridylyltransferase MurU n=1 Tax=Thalassotalea sp. LPB0316 TaxID=2769490 RepID=UPI00186857A5|nr:nucleotidyltransferase family protein [Thalassotalea sp. LPB0316]QOL26646.1 nucleotidyltransferase family protein [Thalassotalea sp. LPB0316]
MKAMILAAGKGERMRPLTETCPKPMLKVNGKPLLEHHIIQLKNAGITDIVINHAWYGEVIVDYFGNGQAWQVSIEYSAEAVGELETAGGIIKALPLLDDEPFVLVNGDVYCQLDYQQLPQMLSGLAHLCLVENPEHNLTGDFGLNDQRVMLPSDASDATYTYSGIAVLSPSLFKDYLNHHGPLPLGPLLKAASEQGLVSGQLIDHHWTDVGTPERLALLNQQLQQNQQQAEK